MCNNIIMKLNFDKLVKQETINLRYKSLYDEFEVIIKILRDKNAVIKKLNLYYNDITLADGKFTHALANNNTLEVLHLYDNSIGVEGTKCLAAALVKNNTLRELDLTSNNIGEAGAKYLAEALKECTNL